MVIFCVVSDAPKLGSLVFLDCKTMKERARINFEPEDTVPMPMHGIFVDKK